jgi:hypothetical protein
MAAAIANHSGEGIKNIKKHIRVLIQGQPHLNFAFARDLK